MDSPFHFIFSIIVGMVLGIDKKFGLKTLIIFSLIAVLIDIDHLCMFDNKISLCERGIFHLAFFVFLFPLFLFFVFHIYERPRGEIRRRCLSLLLLVLFSGHLICYIFTGEKIKLFYPFSNEEFSLPFLKYEIGGKYIVNVSGIDLTIYFFILYFTKFIERFIFFLERRQLEAKKALILTFKKEVIERFK